MSQAIDAVLAGTKGFAVALLAPLTARIGNRPRVAGDPSQVLGLCSGPSALAVVEFLGEGSIPTIQVLVRDGRGLRIVAGVPAAHASAESTLRALGVETGRWDGKTDGVIAAVERVVAAMGGAPAPAPARPLVAPAAAPAPARPPAPATARPAAPPPPGAEGPLRAGAIPPAKPATAPAGSARPVNAPPAARSAPSLGPAPAGAAPRPASIAPVAVRPESSAPPAAQARAAAPRPAPAVAVATRPEPRAAPPAPGATSSAPRTAPATHLFDDLEADVNVDVDDLTAPAPPVDFHAPGVYEPPPSTPAAAWPSGLATPGQAEDALSRALQERADLSRPLQALALRTLGSLSDLERAVLKGKPQPLDPEPIRKAAVMRLRVAEALASAPPPGGPVDSAALSIILGEIDGLLAEVGSLLTTAPAELAPALEAIRNSLVREAIDFSEAGQRAATTGAPPAQVSGSAARPPPSERAASAKMLSVQTPQDAALDKVERRRKVVAFAVLAVVALGAIGFHGWREMSKRDVRAPPTLPGAPSNSVASIGSKNVQLVISKTGTFDAAELERFRASEALRGNRVEEISPGVLKVTASEPRK